MRPDEVPRTQPKGLMSFNIKHGLIDEPTDLGLRLDAQVCVCVCVCLCVSVCVCVCVCLSVALPGKAEGKLDFSVSALV